jgi:hypothetical protein
MRITRIAVLLFALSFSLLAVPNAQAELIPSADGLTVYDTLLKVRWLADANLAATETFGVSNINPYGSMDYETALQWVDALNGLNGGVGYLGHNNWTLPTTPTYPATDPSCLATGPHGNSFGFGCIGSDMGSLFCVSLSLQYPNTSVPIPDNTVGPFIKFQPYLYWSNTSAGGNGYHTFSFNTGWAGSNVDGHYMYALPMIEGNPFDTSPTDDRLQPSADGKTVYDPKMDVTWLANANLSRTREFGAQCLNTDGTLCINSDGSMTHTTALNWIDGMNAAAYLGQTNWTLPPDPSGCGGFGGGSGCTDAPMGRLYYKQLELSQGTPVVPTPDIDIGPFYNVQPYLYWSCSAPYTNPPCQNPPPAPGFEWSFSFGNGFQGTDVLKNDLYVMVYFPETPVTNLSITPANLNFGNVNVGQSANQVITITNQVTSNVRLTGNVGTLVAPFSVQSGGGAFSLTPGQSITVTVRFSPTVAGVASGSLTISHNATNQSSPITISLSGIGINPNAPIISVTPTSNDYGNVKVKRSKTASFTIKNNGKTNLSILTSTIAGPDAWMFAITGGNGAKTIKSGKSLTIKVAFKPTSKGSKSAKLEITSNDPVTLTIDIPLSGTGQ